MSEIFESEIEKMFKEAALDKSKRADFYDALLKSDIYLLGNAANKTPGAEQILNLVTFDFNGKPTIPFFTSSEKLEKFAAQKRSFIKINCKVFFETHNNDVNFYLNPKSELSKIFYPSEIKDIVSGNMQSSMRAPDIKAGMSFEIGMPAEYPQKLVDLLIEHFKKNSKVKKAYLSLIGLTTDDIAPHIIIGIDTDEEEEDIAHFVIDIIEKYYNGKEMIDLMKIRNDSISEYFITQTRPFYENLSLGELQ